MSKKLIVEELSKSYCDKLGYNISLLSGVSINLKSKFCVSVLAPKGSGKSSFLKILTGLEDPSNGSIESDFEKIVFIPSKPSSFPWMSVIDNVKFNSGLSDKTCMDIIKKVGLEGYEKHFPHNKSIGFRFRISLGRAMANNADLIVIDEPFNNLNSSTRNDIYSLIRSLYKNESVSFLFGTSNISEAIFLSDKIFILNKLLNTGLDEINIDLPELRPKEIFQSERFLSLRSIIESKLQQD